jgi:hypothetical protein
MAIHRPDERSARSKLTPDQKAALIEEMLTRRSDIRPDTTTLLVRLARGDDDDNGG